MSRDATERLAFSVAKRLRSALGCRAEANERANGYGTVSAAGHSVVELLWMQCTRDSPERALTEADRDTANMPPIWGDEQLSGTRPIIPRLPTIFHRRFHGATTIAVTTRLWVLDELRWLTQRDSLDEPRTPLDTILSRLNHGNAAVTVSLDVFVDIAKHATRS